eukprot:m.214423 g.214423  ORF g.214423 m.214423 type:complete len:52 (+) comp25580_c0_seq4:4734-4889(+)
MPRTPSLTMKEPLPSGDGNQSAHSHELLSLLSLHTHYAHGDGTNRHESATW